ncbi:MAG TPA: hypothetical protein VGD98_23140 [Ktedonobacteraceae bacterium]
MAAAQPEEEKRGQEILITTLDAVPISPMYLEVMTRILSEHGAILAETEAPPPRNVDPTVSMYTVTFPPGTMRLNGMLIHRSFPFELQFPDGYRLNGAQLWPITLREDEQPIHALFLAACEVEQRPDKEHQSVNVEDSPQPL